MGIFVHHPVGECRVRVEHENPVRHWVRCHPSLFRARRASDHFHRSLPCFGVIIQVDLSYADCGRRVTIEALTAGTSGCGAVEGE